MEQVFRIEIPVEAVDKTDTAALQHLESVLQKIFTSMQKNKTTAGEVFDAIEQGASEARAAMNQSATAANEAADSYEAVADAADEAGSEQVDAAQEGAAAADKLSQAVGDTEQAYDGVGSAAQEAGNNSSSAFTRASGSADKFTQRVEKSNRTLRSMFKEKLQLTLAAIDRASPILKSIGATVKGLTSKAWHIAVRMKDFVTAPFRKLYNLINSPITMALSVVGVGFSANDIVNTFNGFESGMSAVKALTGAVDEDFLALKQTAKDLGASTSFSATEASQGMQYLAMAGWDTNEIIAAMPGLLDLAAAGATDLGTAADIVSDVMTAMGMSASESGRAADIFAKAATSSNTTIEGLGNTMKYAAPIAYSFGMSLEDVAAAAALMGNAGIKGEMAGTALRASLLRMSSPTAEMSKAMKALGISFTGASGKMKEMKDIVRMLETSFSGLSESEKLAYAQDLFGTEAASAWLGIINQGADAYDAMAESLYGAEGAAKEMANTRLDNLAGDMQLLSSAAESAKLNLMEKLNPYLRQGVQWLTGKIPVIEQMAGRMIDSIANKGKQLWNFLDDVFNSSDFQNADGFAEKAFVAWDKIIAEPFNTWWDGGGKDVILSKISGFGKEAGNLLHGIILGIFAALKGEEINFDGLDIGGIAKAGAEAAKSFVSSFMAAFNLGGLVGEMPGLMKAGLFGFGALKLGQGGYGIYKTVTGLKAAFAGVTTAAGSAAPAIGAVGARSAVSAVSIGKTTTLLGGLKAALSAIPVWGWVAAAAIAATAVGIKLYADAQERHRQEILHVGEAVEESSQQFQHSADQYREAVAAVEGYREAKTEIAVTFAPITEEDKQTIRDTIAELEADQIEIETILANGGLSELERMKLTAQLQTIEADKITLTFILEKLPPEQIAELEQQVADIEKQQAEIQAVIDGGGLPPEEVAALEQQIAALEAQKVEIQAKIDGGKISPEEIAAIEQQITMLEQQQIDIQALIDGGGLPPEDVAALEKQVRDIEASKICLKAQIEPLTQEEIKLLTDTLDQIEQDKVEIQARIDGGGLPPEEVAALEQQIDDLNKKEVLIKATLGGLSDQEIMQYAAQQLGTSYEQLVPIMNETFGLSLTVEDLQTGAYDPLIESGAIEETKRLETEARLNELRGNVEAAKAKMPETLAEIGRLEGEISTLEQGRQTSIAQGGEETVATAALKAIKAGWETDLASAQRGEITYDELSTREAAYEQRLFDEVYTAGYVDSDVQATLTPEQLRMGFNDLLNSGSADFSMLLSNMQDLLANDSGTSFKEADAQAESAKAKQAEIDTARSSIADVYSGETLLLAADAFKGTDYFGMSVEEIASQYPQIIKDLGAEGEAMFQNMLAGLQQLNEQADYIEAEQQTQPETVVDMAAKATILSDLKTQVEGIAANYQSLSTEQKQAFSASEEGAARLEAVNAALDALGLEKITSLDELGSALSALESVDLSSFTLEAVTNAFGAVSGDAAAAKEKVDALKASLNAINGMATTSSHTHTNYTNNVTREYGSPAAKNATGGIYDGAFLSWVAEDGPEAIIPLGSKRRERGLQLWLQAGEMLGVKEFADGGIMAPYTGTIETIPDDDWDIDGTPPPPAPAPNSNGGGHTITISVAANPTYQIEGGDGDDIIDKLKGKQKELAEIFGEAIAEELEDIVSNMG